MAERDTYQIVLQLKDELSSELRQVNRTLEQTRTAGQETAKGVETFTDRMRTAVQPIRNFTRVIGSIMSFGGAAIILNRIAGAVGDMEKAYVKLHPESQNALGSLTDWNIAMAEMKADTGAVVSSVLTPLRAAFLNIIDPVHAATWEVKQLQVELQKIADKYLTPERKKWESRKEALEAQTKAQEDFNREVNLANYFYGELTKRQKEYAKAQADAKISGNVADLLQLQKAVESAKTAWDAHSQAVIDARIALRNVTEWLAKDSEETNKVSEADRKAAEALAKLIELRAEEIQLMKYRIALRKEEASLGPQFYVAPQSKAGAAGGTAKPIGRTTGTTGLFQFENIELNAQLAAEAEELTRVNDQLAKMLDLTPAIVKEVDVLADAFDGLGLSILQDALVGVADAFGQAIIGAQSLSDSIAQLISSILRSLGPLMIEAGLKQIIAGNISLGLALIAGGGLSVMGAAMFGADRTTQGIPNPQAPRHYASGGVVTQPTLALLGEAGPEAVVPLNPYSGRSSRALAGVGGITIVAPNAKYLDGRTAGQLVRLGLAAMRA